MRTKLQSISILDKLVQNARILVAEGYYNEVSNFSKPRNTFSEILSKKFCIIGEFKKSAPGVSAYFNSYQNKYRINQIARHADAISIITEPNYFLGSMKSLDYAKSLELPILMKDFIIDIQQIESARGCSAILLIDRILSERRKQDLIQYAHQLNLEVILEVDNQTSFEKNFNSDADILAINNRDLSSFKVDVGKAGLLVSQYDYIPKPVLGLSGYSNIQEIKTARINGLSGVLIGTALSRLENPSDFLDQLQKELGAGFE